MFEIMAHILFWIGVTYAIFILVVVFILEEVESSLVFSLLAVIVGTSLLGHQLF